jgi:hypothetical protein
MQVEKEGWALTDKTPGMLKPCCGTVNEGLESQKCLKV